MTPAIGFRAGPRGKFRLSRLLATTALVGCLVTPAFATNYVVGTEAELRSALASHANGDTITLSNDITLTAGGGGNLPEVQSDVTISGGGHTLSGGGAYRGLFVTSGTVRVEDLKITDTLAQGGTSKGGGAGAGLGGALFVNDGATVTVSNVDLSGNQAKGGAASANTSFGNGSGGAGMLGDGGNASASQGGVGGAPDGGTGGTTPAEAFITNDGSIAGTAQDGPAGAAGGTGGGGGGGAAGQRLYVTATSGDATVDGGKGGAGGVGGFGGGGGQGGSGGWNGATAHDPGTASASVSNGGDGGAGGFGGGGGSGGVGGLKGTTQYNGNFFVSQTTSGNGGNGGQAGFGGSGGLGGASNSLSFGGVDGVTLGDGSGAGMGALFVRQGGQLIVEGNLALNGNSVAAGGAGSQAFGSGIFLQGSGNLSFKPGAGETQTISDDIDDMVGVVAQGYVPPAGTYIGNERWGVTVDGEGTLVLSSTNSFSGGVLVSKGTLSVGADANLGNPDGGVALETGTLATTASFATNRDIVLSSCGTVSQAAGTIFTVNGIVSGGGGLTKTGAGTLALTGNNTYGGGTSLEAGTLRLEHDHALGTGSLSASDGTTIQYGLNGLSVANAITIAGDVKFDHEQPGPIITAIPEQAGEISGTGRLVRTGTGGLILSHANSYLGGTIVEGGRLIASVTGALGSGDADIKGGAVLAFTGNQATPTDAGSRTIMVENDGQLQFSDHSNGTTTTVLNEAGGLVALKGNAAPVEVGSLSGAGDVDLDFGTMIVGGLGSDDTISGTIRDGNVPPILLPAAQAGSLVKTGSGALTLSGINTYLGTTTVEEGKLVVNGSIATSSLTTVSSGAVLGGGGTVGATRVEGTIAPGNSIGTLNVKGTFTQVAGSTYAVQLDASTSDRIVVTGAADLQGGTLDVEAAPGGYSLGARYTILTTTDGLTGRYAALTGDAGPLSAFVSVIDSYDTNNAYLDVSKVRDFADAGLTPNQIATGEGLDSLTGGAVFIAVANLATDAKAQAAFDQLSGEIHASAKGMLAEDSRFVRDAANARISAAFGDGSVAALPVMAYGEGGPEMVAADPDRFAVWGQAFGSWGNTDSDGNAAVFDRSTGGLLAGADTLVGRWRVGLLGGYSHSSFDADDRNSSGDADNYHLGLYGGTNWGAIAFRTGAAYSWSSISTKRSVAFDGFTDGLSADYDAGTAQVFGELAYKADAGQFKFEPFAHLAYVSVHTDGFSETGGDAALTSAGSTTDATFTTLGLRASTDLALDGINATARGMLGWRHAFSDTTPLSAFAFAGGDQFTIAGVPIARDAAIIEAGLDLHLAPNATLGLSYTGQFGSGSVDQGAKVDLGVKF